MWKELLAVAVLRGGGKRAPRRQDRLFTAHPCCTFSNGYQESSLPLQM